MPSPGCDVDLPRSVAELNQILVGIEICNDVITSASADDEEIASIVAPKTIFSSASNQLIITLSTFELILSGSAIKDVITAQAGKFVMTLQAGQVIISACAGEDVATFVPDRLLPCSCSLKMVLETKVVPPCESSIV